MTDRKIGASYAMDPEINMQTKNEKPNHHTATAKPVDPTQGPTIFSRKIHEALHCQPQDLTKLTEMLCTLESLIDTLRTTDLEKIMLKHRIAMLIEIASVGGLNEYFHAIRASILDHLDL